VEIHNFSLIIYYVDYMKAAMGSSSLFRFM